MKESHKKFLDTLTAGLVKLLKIVWIILKSFFKATTIDFYNNIKTYWKSSGKSAKPQEKAEEPPKP